MPHPQPHKQAQSFHPPKQIGYISQYLDEGNTRPSKHIIHHCAVQKDAAGQHYCVVSRGIRHSITFNVFGAVNPSATLTVASAGQAFPVVVDAANPASYISVLNRTTLRAELTIAFVPLDDSDDKMRSPTDILDEGQYLAGDPIAHSKFDYEVEMYARIMELGFNVLMIEHNWDVPPFLDVFQDARDFRRRAALVNFFQRNYITTE